MSAKIDHTGYSAMIRVFVSGYIHVAAGPDRTDEGVDVYTTDGWNVTVLADVVVATGPFLVPYKVRQTS